MGLVPVRMKIPQVLKAVWIWEIMSCDLGEEESQGEELKSGVQSMMGI